MSAYAEYFRPSEMPTCTCGRFCEDADQLKLEACPTCGEISCSDCRHPCEWCQENGEPKVGCERCMTYTIDGWAHDEECAAKLKKHEDQRDTKTDKAILNVVTTRMIDEQRKVG